MTLRSFVTAALLTIGMGGYSASATRIAEFTGQTITTSDKTELGRPTRNGQPQTWTNEELYPGVNPTTTAVTYYYKTYTLGYITIVPNNYLEFSFTDTNAAGLLFLSAYRNSYDANNRSLNWLGDLGIISNGYGSDALTFQVGLNYQDNLVLVATTTGGGTSGTNNPFDIIVNGYTDTDYIDAPVSGVVTPEPSTWIELSTGLLAMAGVVRRRLSAAA